jgi:hypothetical protein
MGDRVTYAVRQDSPKTGYCYYGGYEIGGGYSRRPSWYRWESSIEDAEFMSKSQATKIVNSLKYNNPTIIELLIIDNKVVLEEEPK